VSRISVPLEKIIYCSNRCAAESASFDLHGAARSAKQVVAVPAMLAGAEPRLSFNPAAHDSHYAALRQGDAVEACVH
jgi:hypothetical protein